jgi:hypothetical protein
MAAMLTTRFARLAVAMLVTIAAALLFGLFRVVLHQTIARHLQETVQAIPGCTGIRYEKIAIPYFSLQCQIHGASLLFTGTAEEIPLQTIHIRRFRPGDRLPRSLEAAFYGVRLEARQPLMAPLRESLQRLGYHTLTGDLQIQWERRGENKEAWAIDLALRVAEAGGLTLSIRLDQVNADGVAMALANPLNWLLVLPPVELVQGSCDYEDQGLFERALTDAAREQKRRPEQVREALLQNLRSRVQTEKDPRVQEVWRSLEIFCRTPKRITLQTRLSRPIPLGQLLWVRQPSEFIRALGVESTVE